MRIGELVALQRRFFLEDTSKDVEERRGCLRQLWRAMETYEGEILAALEEDLGKSKAECYLTEIGVVKTELQAALKHLLRWSKPKRVPTPIGQLPASSWVGSEPYGVTLIFSPWNYPFQLAICPLIGAIGAGNTAIISCSPLAPATGRVVAKVVAAAFLAKRASVLVPEADTYEEILAERYDFIFFTGSQSVGKLVMAAAAKHLTPMVLELGGKSPCLVDRGVDLGVVAKRIIWGKLLNCGQTCVAPDYVLVPKEDMGSLVICLQEAICQMYGEQVLKNPDYPKLIGERQLDRLLGFVKDWGGEPGAYDRATLKLAPVLMPGATFDCRVMQEEIFGPILPLVAYEDLEALLATLKQKPKPLALYVFSQREEFTRRVLGALSFGGGCINDTMVHLANPYLPFGGVGDSGMGQYHGRYSFEAFSYRRSILKRGLGWELPLRYPPFSARGLGLIRRLFGFGRKGD